MEFDITFPGNKSITFDSSLRGLYVNGKEYIADADSGLVYDQTKDLRAETVRVQMSSNTSTLIPALRVIGVTYPAYFDEPDVIASQNNISFYWKKSKLASFYNLYSTDNKPYEQRQETIKDAVAFLTSTAPFVLTEEYLHELSEPVKVLGFYEGFPIFDGASGLAPLVSRLGIHITVEGVMISTPIDQYAADVYALAKKLEHELGVIGNYKKNRVTFGEKEQIIKYLLNNMFGAPVKA